MMLLMCAKSPLSRSPSSRSILLLGVWIGEVGTTVDGGGRKKFEYNVRIDI
jgi:hypothetical protein